MLRVLADEVTRAQSTEFARRHHGCAGSGSPVAFPKVDFLSPMRRASSVISLAKLSSLPAMPSATQIARVVAGLDDDALDQLVDSFTLVLTGTIIAEVLRTARRPCARR